MVLPTPGSIAMFEGWTKGFQEGLEAKENDQQYVERIHDKILRRCTAASGCIKAREEVGGVRQCGGCGGMLFFHITLGVCVPVHSTRWLLATWLQRQFTWTLTWPASPACRSLPARRCKPTARRASWR